MCLLLRLRRLGGFGGRCRLLAAVEAHVAGGGELLLELLDPARRVDVLQLAL